jgi:hypothetical protein
MSFWIILLVSLLVGVSLGFLTSHFFIVRTKKNLPTIIIFTPFAFLFFLSILFSDIPILDTIRYIFLFLAIGILGAWSYFDKKPENS